MSSSSGWESHSEIWQLFVFLGQSICVSAFRCCHHSLSNADCKKNGKIGMLGYFYSVMHVFVIEGVTHYKPIFSILIQILGKAENTLTLLNAENWIGLRLKDLADRVRLRSTDIQFTYDGRGGWGEWLMSSTLALLPIRPLNSIEHLSNAEGKALCFILL